MRESIYKGEPKYFKDGAEIIKKQFDDKYKGSWHVIVGITLFQKGTNFGSNFSYEQKSAILFKQNGILFLIYRFG